MAQRPRPILGIAARTFRSRRFGEQTSYLRGILAIARKQGMTGYVFGPADIDLVRRRVRGWKPAAGGWRRRWYPLPDVVYDRAWGLEPPARRRLSETLDALARMGIPRFNPDLGDKLDVYYALRRSPALAGHLPETLPLSAENLEDLATRYKRVYVKPARGRQGKGISVCQRTGDGWSVKRASGAGKVRRMSSAEAAVAACRKGRADETFIVQQGLDLVKLRGGTVDIRVIVQRDRHGRWAASAVGVRAGRRGGLVSNLHAGGRALGLGALARGARLKRPLSRVRREVVAVALEAARTMSVDYPTLGELGIDIGLDAKGGIWILEVNRQPGRALFSRAGLRSAWRRSRRRVVEFAKYLVSTASADSSILRPAEAGDELTLMELVAHH